MKPFYNRNGIILYQGDCADVLSKLRRKADVAITDPPYEVEAHTKQRRTRKGSKWDKAGHVVKGDLGFDQISDNLRGTVGYWLPVLTKRWVLTFCQVEAVHKWRWAYESGTEPAEGGSSLEYIRTMIWHKPDAMPQYTGDRPAQGYESILLMHPKGRKRWNGRGRDCVFTFNKAERGPKWHPTSKPLRLMRLLVELFTDPGETVIDPFMGGGSTAVACAELGRKFIGIEIDPKYCDVVPKRLAERQTSLI